VVTFLNLAAEEVTDEEEDEDGLDEEDDGVRFAQAFGLVPSSRAGLNARDHGHWS
jgi:hypothetical protein